MLKIFILCLFFCFNLYGQSIKGYDETSISLNKDYKTNIALNSGFDKNTVGVSKVGTGVFSRNTANALSGAGSLAWTGVVLNDVLRISSSQIYNGLEGKNCEASIDVSPHISSTTNTLTVYFESNGLTISDTQNVSLLDLNTVKRVAVNFPCSQLTGTNDRLVIVAGGALDVLLDKFYVGEATNISHAKVQTDWVSYTPTFTGFGTPSAVNTRWKIDGQDLLIDGRFTCGITTAVEARVSLPLNFVSSSSIGTLELAGVYGQSGNAAISGYVTKEASTSYITFSTQATGTNSLTKNTGSGICTSPNSFSFNARIPIAGLTSTLGTTQACIKDGTCENVFSARMTSAGVADNENIDWINGNCTVNGTGDFTCNFKSSFFSLAPNITITVADGAGGCREVRIYNWTSGLVSFQTFSSAGALTSCQVMLKAQRQGSDYRPKYAVPILTGSLTTNALTAKRTEYVTVGSNASPCAASPCTLNNISTTGWLTVTRSGTGQYTANFTSGVFSSAINCKLTTAGTGVNIVKRITDITTSGFNMSSFTTTTGAAADASFDLECTGDR